MELLLWIFGLCISWGLLQILLYVANGGKSSTARKLPPGPRPLPVIGNLLELGSLPHRSLTKLASVHGPVMSLKLGCITTVVISSATMAQEILQIHDVSFSDRMIPDTVTVFQQDRVGLPWVPVSPLWRNLRRICNMHLFAPKVLNSYQHFRSQKIQELLAPVSKCSEIGSPLNIGEAGFTTMLNLLANSILSMDLADSTSESVKFKEIVGQIMVEAGKPNLADYFPVLKRLDLQGAKQRMMHYGMWMFSVFDGIIYKRLQQREVSNSDRKNDMLDTLLDLCEDKKEGMDLLQMKHLFLATVKETFRLHPAAPLLIPRKGGDTMEVGGYTIPNSSQVLVNVWAIGREPITRENPEEFLPERFLGSKMDVKGQFRALAIWRRAENMPRPTIGCKNVAPDARFARTRLRLKA